MTMPNLSAIQGDAQKLPLHFLFSRRDGIVPLWVEVVALEIEAGHRLVWHLDPLGVGLGVEFAADAQPRLGAGVGDQFDHRQSAGQGRGPPVLADMTEHAVLDRIPFRGAGRIVADLKAGPSRRPPAATRPSTAAGAARSSRRSRR